MVDAIEQFLDVELQHPVILPATLADNLEGHPWPIFLTPHTSLLLSASSV
jgi:hypothetical protein